MGESILIMKPAVEVRKEKKEGDDDADSTLSPGNSRPFMLLEPLFKPVCFKASDCAPF